MPPASQDPSERAPRQTGDALAGLPARRAAVELLDAVLRRRRPLDAVFTGEARSGVLASLSPRDRALARAIAATALRRKGQIDEIFASYLDRPPKGDTGPYASIALAACAQILFLDTPAHAVVNLAVHQARSNRRSSRFAGLLNAVLRKIAEEGPARAAGQDAPRLDTPDWLWRRWETAYGAGTARAIAEAHLHEAPLDLTVKGDAAGWAARLGGHALPTGSVRLEHKGRIETLDGFDEGRWWVQDAAAALPAKLLGSVAGKRVADLCAAPGGKTAQLAHAGAHVTAVDISEQRLAIVRENLKRLRLTAELAPADAGKWRPDAPFDAVLLDAPCSATGTIRRHPDIPHLKSEAEIARLADVQARLLAHALTLLKPGGALLFCTCSLEPEEGEARIAPLLAAGAAMLSPIESDEIAGQDGWLTGEGFIRTLPCHMGADGGMDGFFIARLTAPGA